MKHDTILGVDLGWVSQLESIGYKWVDDSGTVSDPIRAAKELGANLVRLRVFVNPPTYGFWVKPEKEMKGYKIPGGLVMLGFCDRKCVTEMAKRAKALDMKLMIDFHYSDHFADPVFQDTPDAWKELKTEELAEKVKAHTEEVLLSLKGENITPEYVQVGNEVNSGILHPTGERAKNPETMTMLLNAGYEAVKAVSPDTCVVTHVSMGHVLSVVRDFFDVFFKYNGKTDMIGLSYYPAWVQERHDPKEFLMVLNQIAALYEKPIVLSEIGGFDYEEEETYSLLFDTLKLTDKVNDHACRGLVYWEPEVYSDILPDHYPLGAAKPVGEKILQYTKALSAYKTFAEGGTME